MKTVSCPYIGVVYSKLKIAGFCVGWELFGTLILDDVWVGFCRKAEKILTVQLWG